MRTFLTTLGILIGVASVVSMISIGEGAKEKITSDIKKMGSNLLFVRPGASTRHGMRKSSSAMKNRLELRDVDSIKKEARYINDAAAILYASATIVYKNRNVRTTINGVGSSFPAINNFQIKYGTAFDKRAVRLKERVSVLGWTVVENLFNGENPVGQYIKINRVNFLVIGVFEPKGSTSWQDMDDVAVIPVTTAQKRLFGTDKISAISIQVKDEDTMDRAEREVTKIIKRQHSLGEKDEPDFHMRSQLEILERVEEATQVFTLLLGGIASISLLVGGIGIMNIMLVTVMERIKEIGLRKAVGAQRKDILYQFLTEAVIICFIGGIFGIILGVLVSRMISKFSEWGTYIPFYSILMAFGFAFIVGIFFGIYPALKASALRPIDALRYE